jgi:hypothetical protein
MMLKPTLLLGAFLLAMSAHGQLWLEAGGKFNFGPSGFYNANIAADENHDYSLSMAFAYGIAVGVNIGDYHGFNVEGLLGSYYQNLSYRGDSVRTRNQVEWEVIDLALLYRYYSPGGIYLEAGPKMSNVRNVKQTFARTPVDAGGQYSDRYFSGVLGVGAILAGSEVLVLKFGMRAEYAFTDLVSDLGVKNQFPAFYTQYAEPATTSPYRLSFGFELSFGLGGTARAACGRRTFVLGGRYR